MLQSVLLAVDASPSAKVAATYARFLCQKLDGALHAVYVIDSRLTEIGYQADEARPQHVLATIRLSEQRRKQLEQQGESLLNSVKRDIEAAGISCRTEMRTGIPAVQLLEAGQDCDLIVMGRRGESAKLGDKKGLGGVAERILRTATQPVVLAGVDFQDIRRVLLGYDGSEPAREAMIYAAELAQRLKWPMLAVSVHRDEEVARRRLETVQHYAEAHKLDVSLKVRQGDPADALLDTAQEGDLITMGAFGEGRIREWLLGSTTEAVLRAAVQPVLLHR